MTRRLPIAGLALILVACSAATEPGSVEPQSEPTATSTPSEPATTPSSNPSPSPPPAEDEDVGSADAQGGGSPGDEAVGVTDRITIIVLDEDGNPIDAED